MSASPEKTALITGANTGIGKEVARQLALRPEFGHIYLASRNQGRATTAKTELEVQTGRDIFEIIQMDVSDPKSVRSGAASIKRPVDALVMNAGIVGPSSMEITDGGVTKLAATNLLGHVALLDALLAEGKLGETAVFVGSEAAVGVPKLKMKRPTFESNSADEFASVINGSFFDGKKADPSLAFGQSKYIAALWMGHMAREYPDRRFITVSPGNTTGTHAPDDLKLPLRIAAKYVMPALGFAHGLEVGAKRIVDAVTDDSLSSGAFYASAANKLTGPLVNQTDIVPDFSNPTFQDNANEAIHRFIS